MNRKYLPLLLIAICIPFLQSCALAQSQPQTTGESAPEANVQQTLSEAGQDLGQSARDALKAVSAGDFRTAAGKLGDLLLGCAIPAMTALIALIIAYFVASFLARLASTPIRSRVDETLGRFIGKVIYYVIMVSALLGVLQFFGIGVTSFAAVLASAGFAIGLAFQGTLSNFSSGVMLLVFRPFAVGDVITAAGITAKVNEIDLFTTTFDTPDNRRIIVPNGMISSGIIENVTHHTERRVEVPVGVEYSADIDHTREVLISAAESVEGVIEGEGRGIQVSLSELADSSVNWTVRGWFPSADFWSKRQELIRAIKMHLDQAGIGIPFPQMDVRVAKLEELGNQ